MTATGAIERPILIVGGTGKTGRRVAERLQAAGVRTRRASRNGETPLDWHDAHTWSDALEGASAAYITFFPDIAMPGAAGLIGDFAAAAVAQGVERLVLLSGRGEEGAEASEDALKASGADWTILRASWFNQNFSEGFLLDAVRSGTVALPAPDVPEPFTDADDIAEVAVKTLTEAGHVHKTYELTGAEALTYTEAVAEISHATGRDIRFTYVPPDAFDRALESQGVPAELRGLLLHLFTTILDGRNSSPQGGIQTVLGREPTRFQDYASRASTTGVWNLATSNA